MPKRPFDPNNLHLVQDLLVTVIKARMTMDAASARADLLLNIFLAEVETVGTEGSFIQRALNNLELDLLDARDAPEPLRGATVEMAKAMWSYRMAPDESADQRARDAFERWESVYRQVIGEAPAETYMDMENGRCRSEADYYSQPPLPFGSRVRVDKGN
jgi:hypothetical protein